MMRFEVVTLFPEFFTRPYMGLLAKAHQQGAFEVESINPREFASDPHRTVDDAPYGGGSGMVLMPGPIVEALEEFDRRRQGGKTRRILLTPQGQTFNQKIARRLAGESCLTFVCGRYEGFDERIRDYVDEELSLGDFVLLGGEQAALTMMEATGRLLPDVVGNQSSLEHESHEQNLLEYPQYTRPLEFRNKVVPDILSSGHHANIERWRRKQALLRTWQRRPDLLREQELSTEDQKLLEEAKEELDGA